MAIIQTLGVASCLGGSMRFCGYGAEILRDEFARHSLEQRRVQLQWHMLHPRHQGSKEENLAKLNNSISQITKIWTKANKPFLVIGGDHSCAMGTWSGMLNAMQEPQKLGLIWLDAHMDGHTFLTSPSGNVHGMPLAALLGKADEKLGKMYPGSVFIKPENLILIGVRSYEAAESGLLKRAGVQVVFNKQINSFKTVLVEAVDKLGMDCQKIGISIDLDVVEPADAPGVETPASGGIQGKDLLAGLSLLNRHPKLCALEISEFNPEKDINNKTLHLIRTMVQVFYGEVNKPYKSLGSSRSGIRGKSVPS